MTSTSVKARRRRLGLLRFGRMVVLVGRNSAANICHLSGSFLISSTVMLSELPAKT